METTNQNFIDDFTNALAEFDAVLAKVPEGGLDFVEKEGEWSIRQVIHHVADDCNVYTFVIERALVIKEAKIFFVGFPGNETWANALEFDNRPVSFALDLIHTHRSFLAELVGHFPDRWEQKAYFYNETFEKIAENSVRDMMVMLTKHMQEHTQMINKILHGNL